MPYRNGFVACSTGAPRPRFRRQLGRLDYSRCFRVQWLNDVAKTKRARHPELYSNDVLDDAGYARTASSRRRIADRGRRPPDNVVVRTLRHIYVPGCTRRGPLEFLLVPQRDERTRTMGPIGGFIELSPERRRSPTRYCAHRQGVRGRARLRADAIP